jgi:DNA-binding MarR family transcriptional regulator
VLADRAGVSKQAMNQLLRSLEDCGYIARLEALEDRRTRAVHLTKRGRGVLENL